MLQEINIGDILYFKNNDIFYHKIPVDKYVKCILVGFDKKNYRILYTKDDKTMSKMFSGKIIKKYFITETEYRDIKLNKLL